MNITNSTKKLLCGLWAAAIVLCGGCSTKEEREARRQAAIEAKVQAEQEAEAKKAAEEAEKKRIAAEKEAEKKRIAETPCTVVDMTDGEECYYDTRYYMGNYYWHHEMQQKAIGFDTDGDTNTVEWIAIKNVPCSRTRIRLGLIKPGDVKTRAEWERFLTHDDEVHCDTPIIKGHRLVWDTKVDSSKKPSSETAGEDETPYTLIKKELGVRYLSYPTAAGRYSFVLVRQGILYFDSDGDPSTVEMIATKQVPCTRTKARFDFLRPGDTKTRAEWERYLTHEGERSCREENDPKGNRDVHRMQWDRIG